MNNVYVCEIRIKAFEIAKISIKAMTKKQAKSICRKYMRKRGYKVLLKDVHVLYIDNNRKQMN